MTESEFNTAACDVLKVDRSLGLVFGWAIVCKVDGEPYYDLQGDHIPEDLMLESVTEFAKSTTRPGTDLHTKPDGMVVHSFPLNTELAKALGITTPKTGWLIAMKPNSAEVLEKYASGEYTGFSVGGNCEREAVVEA